MDPSPRSPKTVIPDCKKYHLVITNFKVWPITGRNVPPISDDRGVRYRSVPDGTGKGTTSLTEETLKVQTSDKLPLDQILIKNQTRISDSKSEVKFIHV